MTLGGEGEQRGISRRALLRGAGASAATWVIASRLAAPRAEAAGAGGGGIQRAVDVDAAGHACPPFEDMAEAAAVGATAIRFVLDWGHVEGASGRYDWSRYESFARLLQWHGLAAIPVVQGCPNRQFASGQIVRGTGGIALPYGGQALNGYEDFLLEVTRFFEAAGVGLVALEIFNGPGSGAAVAVSDPAVFRRMAQTATVVARSHDVDGKSPTVIAGSYSDAVSVEYLNEAVARLSGAEVGLIAASRTEQQLARGQSAEVALVGEIARIEKAAGTKVWVGSLPIPSATAEQQDRIAAAAGRTLEALVKEPACVGASLTLPQVGALSKPVEREIRLGWGLDK